MNTSLLAAIQLVALLCTPMALVATYLVGDKSKYKLLIFGPVVAFALASLNAMCSLSQSEIFKSGTGLVETVLCLDPASCIMLTGITFIAAIVIGFSDRYLLGEPDRLAFMRRLSLLSSSAALLSVTNSMILSFVCWFGLSVGLREIMRLQKSSTQEAATVFRYHLLSDVTLLVALVLTVMSTGYTQYDELVKHGPLLGQNLTLPQISLSVTEGTVVSLLLILSFGVKSALFPFHRWLLGTLAAPTPLSGLLHAGVVNVSAIMAWRMMPILDDHPDILLLWGIWSALSAIVGTLSMSAQPDVKRKLVYSTVGQMGFMSLQCAAGSPSAAIFHLLAHGMFKCHLFLQSGSAVEEGVTKRKFGYSSVLANNGRELKNIVLVAAVALSFCSIYLVYIGNGLTAVSAVIAGAAILCSAPSLKRVGFALLFLSWLSGLGLALLAGLCGAQFEHLVQGQYSYNVWLLPAFLALFSLVAAGQQFMRRSRLAKALYVHSLNGFYAHEAGCSDLRPGTRSLVSEGI